MLDKIKSAIETLSPAETRVAVWLSDHPRQGLEASLAQVARAAGTSEPTVVRFCRSLGLTGFRELKIRLAESLSRPEGYVHRDVLPDDSAADAAGKVIDSAIRALIEVRRGISGLPLDGLVEAMAGARQLVFAGLGASGHVARDARQKFFRLGIPCSLATDEPTILQSAAIASANDLYLFVSHTGARGDLVRAAGMARAQGACVVAVTDGSSALAREATYLLDSHSTEDTNLYTPMASRLAQLVLLDAVQVGLALRMGDEAAAKLRAAKLAL